MSLYLLHSSESAYSLFLCYGLFRIGEKNIATFVNERRRFRNVVDLVGFYKFEPSEAKTQFEAFSQGRVTTELRKFLLLHLPEVEAEPEFKLGVGEPKLASRIFGVTNVPCICDEFVLELLRGVHLHIDALTQFPEPCNLDEAPTKPPVKKKSKGVPLLKYEFRGCMVEDLKKGKKRKHVATLMDMVTIHYTVKRMKDDKILFDTTTPGPPVKICLGTGQLIKALDMGICGMFVRGKRRFMVPPSMGYETKSGRGTKGVNGPKGSSGHWLVIDVTLVAIDR